MVHKLRVGIMVLVDLIMLSELRGLSGEVKAVYTMEEIEFHSSRAGREQSRPVELITV